MAAKRRKNAKRSGAGSGQAKLKRQRRLGLMSIGCLLIIAAFVVAIVVAVIGSAV